MNNEHDDVETDESYWMEDDVWDDDVLTHDELEDLDLDDDYVYDDEDEDENDY